MSTNPTSGAMNANSPKRTNPLNFKIKVKANPHDPLILDRMIDVAAIAYWGIYALWGLLASILGIATITNTVGSAYNFLWSGAIGTLCTIACAAAISLFFETGPRLTNVVKKQIELWSVRLLSCIIFVYPILLFITALSGDANRAPSAVLSLTYLIFPLYRTYVLKKRIIAFERAQKDLINGSH